MCVIVAGRSRLRCSVSASLIGRAVPLENDMQAADIDPAIREATRFAARIFHRDVGHDVFDGYGDCDPSCGL